MGFEQYMRQGNNGEIQVACANLPNKGFIDAIKVKDICKLKFLTKQEKENIAPGSPDVMLKHITGEIEYISRSDISKKYTDANGNKLKMMFLKNDRDYIVYCNCNESYKILKLPNNCSGAFKGKRVKPGDYVVMPIDSQGNPCREKMGIVSSKMFRKMFKIPMQAVIKRHMGSGSKNFSLFKQLGANNRRPSINISSIAKNTPVINLNVEKQMKPRINSADLGINPSNIKIPTVTDKINTVQSNRQENNKYKFTVINQILDMNGKLLGYSVKELDSGTIKQLNTAQLAVLCEQKLVNNVMLGTIERTGKKFLKGNGIVLKNLPSVLA